MNENKRNRRGAKSAEKISREKTSASSAPLRFIFSPTGLLLTLIITLYLLLALAYGAVNPLFEAPDEDHHFFTVTHIAETRTLPVATAVHPARQEAAQPPLYYVLGAPLIAWIDTSTAVTPMWRNPAVDLGNAATLTDINAYYHTPAEAWPWRGFALAVHILRAFSAVLGVGTLLFIYGSARLFRPHTETPALLATAVVAFLPQYIFLHSAVSNDSLIIILSSAGLWQLLRLWFGGVTRRRLLLLSVTVALAILTKTAGLLLLLFALGVLLARAYHSHRLPTTDHRLPTTDYPLPAQLATLLLPVLLLSGWLFLRNWQLYGDVTAANQFIALAGGDRAYTLRQVWGDLDRVWYSALATFGWMNVRPPQWVYGLWHGILLLGGAGAAWGVRRNLRRSLDWARLLPALGLAGWGVLVGLGWLQFMLRTPADQGRLLFPALLPIALLLGYGLSQWPRLVHWLAGGTALFTAVYSLGWVIAPAYAPPRIIAETAVPPTADLVQMPLGQGLTLLAGEAETDTAVPGEWVWFTLYWRVDDPPAQPPTASLVLIGQNETVGELHTVHGRGLSPANFWPRGAVLAERTAVQIKEGVRLPTEARLHVSLGEGATAVVGAVKIIPAQWPPLQETALAQLGEGIEIREVTLPSEPAAPGETVPIQITWQVTAPPGDANLTTLIHLGEAGQPPLAQADGPPLNGHYPTRLWEAGEVFTDTYRLTLPEDLADGRYPIQIGLYNAETGARLPVFVESSRAPFDTFSVYSLTTRR